MTIKPRDQAAFYHQGILQGRREMKGEVRKALNRVIKRRKPHHPWCSDALREFVQAYREELRKCKVVYSEKGREHKD